MSFTFRHEEPISQVSIEMHMKNEGHSLTELLMNFEDFLRACGFSWVKPGTIVHYDPDNLDQSPEEVPEQQEFEFINHHYSAKGSETE